jgi:hypothetical protein
LCGATAGSLSAFITCPLDNVKTFRQIELGEKVVNKNSKTLFILKQIYQTKGIGGYFAGNIFLFLRKNLLFCSNI